MFLEIRNVTKVFRTAENKEPIIAVKGLSMGVNKGEFLCIIGPVGCGKSTVLNMIAGFERPTEGKILLEGLEVKGPSTDRIMVFQESTLFPWMTTLQNVEFGLRLKGLSKEEAEKKAKKYLSIMGLENFCHLRPHELSGGMKRKVELARALALEPKLLLMDEPLSSIDAISKQMLMHELLKVWNKHQITIIYVTHDIDEALFLANRIIIFTARPARVKKEVILHKSKSIDISDEILHLKKSLMAELVKNQRS